MTALRRRHGAVFVAGLLAVTGVLAGCGNPFTDSANTKDDSVQTVTEADTKHTIDEYAAHIAKVTGVELTRYETNSAPCTGRFGENSKDVYTTLGAGQIFVPQAQHATILADLRKQWESQGFVIKAHREATGKVKDKLHVVSPDDFDIELGSAEPPTALFLLINSPCRRSPTPLY